MGNTIEQSETTESNRNIIELISLHECGRTTFLKQLQRYKENYQFTEEKKRITKVWIYNNIILFTKTIIIYYFGTRSDSNHPLFNTMNEILKIKNNLLNDYQIFDVYTEELFNSIKLIIKDSIIKEIIELEAPTLFIPDGMNRFLKKIDCINTKYTPDENDELFVSENEMNQIQAKITHYNYRFNNLDFTFQSNMKLSRKTNDKMNIIFFFPLNDYYKDNKYAMGKDVTDNLNELDERMKKLNLSNSDIKHIIVILSKYDQLEKYFYQYKLKNYFKEFEGSNLNDHIYFFIQMIQSKFDKITFSFFVADLTNEKCMLDILPRIENVIIGKETYDCYIPPTLQRKLSIDPEISSNIHFDFQ